MTKRGIIFNTEDVRAILDGRKTVFRRMVKGLPDDIGLLKYHTGDEIPELKNKLSWFVWEANDYWPCTHEEALSCPFGKIGDRLYVKETWSDMSSSKQELGYHVYKSEMPLVYQDVDEEEVVVDSDSFRWKSPAIMPKSAARIWLEIVDVRFERLADITEEDAVKEGFFDVDEFHENWISRFENWFENPWVWVVEFKVVKP